MLSVMTHVKCHGLLITTPTCAGREGTGIWNRFCPHMARRPVHEPVKEARAVEGDPALSGRPGSYGRRGRRQRRKRRWREEQLLHLHQCPAGEQLRVPERRLRRSLNRLAAACTDTEVSSDHPAGTG